MFKFYLILDLTEMVQKHSTQSSLAPHPTTLLTWKVLATAVAGSLLLTSTSTMQPKDSLPENPLFKGYRAYSTI